MSQKFPFLWMMMLFMLTILNSLMITNNMKMKNKKLVMKNKKINNNWW